MGRAIGAAVSVFASGFLGVFLGDAGFFLAIASVITGWIVYELEAIRRQRQDGDAE